MTSLEIANILKMNRNAIIRYLKRGNTLGWCSYDPKEEMRKSCRKNGKSTGKQVEIFKDGVSLGIFPSSSFIERQSEKLFGIKLWQTRISEICRKNIGFHKGYTFKYHKQIK